MRTSDVHRREFLKTTSATAAVSTALVTAPKTLRAAGPLETIRLGVIGCGGQGRGAHLDGLTKLDGVQVAYVCDPDESRRADAVKFAPGAQAVADLRQILDDTSIDAVTIATPDHWHTPAAMLALVAGKHVYVEKPCSHNLREGQYLVAAARRSGKIVQHGTQSRSNPGFIEAMQMLHDGVIGEVLVARAWNIQRRESIGHARPTSPPAGFDYDLWIGPAPMVPFQANRHHYTWHWWYDFGTGDVGNDGVHELDMARWGLGLNRHPDQIAVAGGKYFFDDDQQFPDTVTATFDYSTDDGKHRQIVFEMRLWSTNYPEGVDGGIEFYGTKGKMFMSRRGKFQLSGPRNRRSNARPAAELKMDVTDHLRSWLEAIRGQNLATADAQQAHLSASLCHLANIAVRTGSSFRFDPQHETILENPAAEQLLARRYREDHWAIPRLG